MVARPWTVCKSGRHDLTLEENIHRDSRGRRRGCLPCRKETVERWRAGNKNAARKSRFKNEYGISVEEYDEMYDRQQGKCLISKTPMERYALNVDHCHHDGHVRGLLCPGCNRMLGAAQDDPERLRRAAEYLERN